MECCGGWRIEDRGFHSRNEIVLLSTQLTPRQWFLTCILISIQFNWKLFYYFPFVVVILWLKSALTYLTVCHNVYTLHTCMTRIFTVIEINDDGILIAQMENVKQHITYSIFISHGFGACQHTCWTAYPTNIQHTTYIIHIQASKSFSLVSFSNLNNCQSVFFLLYFKDLIKWL